MGMAASQVRFLTLQDRKSTIGMRLGILSNRKMALTRDQNKAAKAYNEAYSQKKLQWYDSINGKYTDITYNAMMTPNAGNGYTPYLITDRNTGKVILDSSSTTVGLLGNSSFPQNGTYWQENVHKRWVHGLYVGAEPYCSADRSMDSHMHFLAGIDGDHYIPGSVTYNQAEMAPYIIEQMMGVPNFDRDRFIYKGVSNKDITIGGYQKFVHSDLMANMNYEIGATAASTSESILSVWEFRETHGNAKYTANYSLDLLSGDTYCYAAAISNGHTKQGADTDNIEYKSQHAYIDNSGNVHKLTDKIYWKTLYEAGATVILPYEVAYADPEGNVIGRNISASSDDDYPTCVNFSEPADIFWDGDNKSLKNWIDAFVNDVNDSGLLKYQMSSTQVQSVTDATFEYYNRVFGNTFGLGGNSGYAWGAGIKNSNVDPVLHIDVTSVPDAFKPDNNGNTDWNTGGGLKNNVDAIEYVIYSEKEGDPVGYGKENGSKNIAWAIAKQANGMAGVIRVQNDVFTIGNNKELQNVDWGINQDEVVAISLKNMMDVALTFIEDVQQKIAQEQSVPDGWSLCEAYCQNNAYDDFQTGNGHNFTEPSNYNQGELEVFQQGETKVASAFSIKSNFDMLEKKISHMSNLEGTPAANVNLDLFNTIYNQSGYEGSNMKGILRQIIAGNGAIGDKQLIALANMNAWICEALEQDYSTPGGVETINELLQKIQYTAYLYTEGLCTEDDWATAQDPYHYPEGFYYDNDTIWERRTQLFTQDSEDKVATEQLDIEGQLTVNQLHQFHFYENLVKECLERGWKSSSMAADGETTSLHLQNGTWLINDNMAKSSSRVFEVADKEAREEALSKYEALQSELKIKEERIDIQMEKLETEQNAIKTELDSLTSIIKDNIQSTFKIFS